jgi:dienelactone hydrolase
MRDRVARLVGWAGLPASPQVEVVATRAANGYEEQAIRYRNSEGEVVPAYLLIPARRGGPLPGVVVYHQHNTEWHLGKSEVAGIAGDPLQAFGPTLARSGLVVLAPDAICFEDRRRNGPGLDPLEGDWLQHYNEMAYRLLDGRLLTTTVVRDAALAVSALSSVAGIDPSRVGAVGHSMGGHTALLHAALDERVRFACASGAAGSFRSRIASGTGIEMSQLIPNILATTDIHELVGLIAPRPVLLVSATDDPYSSDADEIEREARRTYEAAGAPHALEHARYMGGHALDEQRFKQINAWIVAAASR